MNLAGQAKGRQRLTDTSAAVTAVVEGSAGIGDARDVARTFLESLQAEQGLPVSSRALGMAQLVVSELVTNARKHAPGPCVMTLEADDGAVAVTVWDSCATLPQILPPDPARVGQHGLEIVMALCRSFEVHREPVGKRIRASVVLADDPDGDAAGRRPM
ncbi:ATP-binding protein [Streptomyces tauricus]|uniref:ATP-binding protein n=1 Tax=Streptomyces tauricus TaxID=68274 RepID=UPI00167A15F7|nr:ATP-binding protein [Streptomyces tauricus]MCW8103618.1 ATP-binding protein [Streptomyces tauricus]GHA07454.1 ATP-binding protein [Streptomyces tauricus]